MPGPVAGRLRADGGHPGQPRTDLPAVRRQSRRGPRRRARGRLGDATRLADEIAATTGRCSTWPPKTASRTGCGPSPTRPRWRRSPPTSRRGTRSSPTGTTAMPPTWSCRRRMRASGGAAGPWDQGLALLVDSAAYPPRIDAIHRVIPGLPPSRRRGAAKAGVRGAGADRGPARGADASWPRPGAHGPAFLVGGGGSCTCSPTRTRPRRRRPCRPAARRTGAACPRRSCSELLIGRLWGSGRRALGARGAPGRGGRGAGRGRGRRDGRALQPGVRGRRPRQSPRMASGCRAKSTSFGPKPRTGLLIRAFDAS